MIKHKSLLTIFLLILLGTLMACSGPEPAPGNDILAPLPSTTEQGEAGSESSAGSGRGNGTAEDNAELPTLLELLSEDPNLVFFTNGLNTAGLTDDLQSGGPFTVFAPSNVAFSQGDLIVSQMDPALVGALIDAHVAEGAFSGDGLLTAGSVTTLAGESLAITQESDAVKVAYAPLVGEARFASNGTLYVIDSLLLPQEIGPEISMWGVLQADGRFTTFVSILAGTEMMISLRFNDSYDAILAPTDAAFAKMPVNVTSWLESNPHDYEFVASFHLLAPDGWPQGVDLTVADMVELGSVQTRVANSGSGFGFGYEELIVSQNEAGVTIGNAQIVEGDIDASNGIVHGIDTVLIPQALLEHIE